MSSRISFVLVLIALAIIIYPFVFTSSPDHTGQVDWVIDGDTIIVDDITVRFFGINAPELGSRRGELALYHMIDLIYGENVDLFCFGFDKYERWLCDVVLDGVDVGANMIDVGLAREWVDYGP